METPIAVKETGMGDITHSLRSIGIIWYREILRALRNRAMIVSSLGMPIIFLFIFGEGLSPSMGNLTRFMGGGADVNFIQYIFPGVIGMNVIMASIMSGVSVVWDREFGFLKEVLVAPVPRVAVVLGKVLGGATVGMLQGVMMLIFAPLLGVRLSVGMVLELIPVLFLLSLSLTSLGVAIAARMRSLESFQMIMQFILFPMIFLSGAMFPMRDLPAWMDFLVHINPVTYAVDPLRQIVLRAQNIPEQMLAMLPQFGLGVEVFGHAMTIQDDLMIITIFGALMVVLAMWLFSIRD